jgi:6,7-dimethyl-8-ribityllumazine synthase
MSGGHAPQLILDAAGMKVAIVASQWHSVIMDGLISGATSAIEKSGAVSTLVRVPGAFELPLGCQRQARTGNVEAIVALGVVIQGGTPHFDYVCRAATDGLVQVSLNEGLPIGFGLLTVNNEDQGLDRAGLVGSSENKGEEAALAAIAMALDNRVGGGIMGFR